MDLGTGMWTGQPQQSVKREVVKQMADGRAVVG